MDWILPSHPDLNMVVTTTDASAIGSYLALQVNEISGKDIAVFSGDATQDALHMIAEDNSAFRGTVNLYPFQGCMRWYKTELLLSLSLRLCLIPHCPKSRYVAAIMSARSSSSRSKGFCLEGTG